MYTVDNAVIMAAGTASRFAPLSYETHKALIPVRGEILIEREIRQLREAGVPEIYVVVGYKAASFAYLEQKFGVRLVYNPDYLNRNNNGSLYAVRGLLKNTYVCSSDNYFSENPFEREVTDCYYAAVYSAGPTKEWCMQYTEDGTICGVRIGGADAWYMLGHTFWNEAFSKKFVEILEREYNLPGTAGMLWESIYMRHLDELKMKIRKYAPGVVFEFDTLDELRQFDAAYVRDTRSQILKDVAKRLNCGEEDLCGITAYKDGDNAAAGFTFFCRGAQYAYAYKDKTLRRK